VGGDQEAMVRVGHMLLAGYGIRQDKAEAAKWLRAAW
jgi:TPR repeat protein